MPFTRLLRDVRARRICEANLPFGSRPAGTSRLLIISQAQIWMQKNPR